MKKITLLVSFLLFFSITFSFSQTTIEWESGAVDNGATVTSTELAGNTITISSSGSTVNITSANYSGVTGNSIFTDGGSVATSMIVSFASPVDITSIYHADPIGFGETLTFTPTGGSNSVVMSSHSPNSGATAMLGWTNVTSFTITGAASSGQYAIDEIILQNSASGDTTGPVVQSVSVPSNATYVASQNLDFTVNFDENVTVVTTGGTPQIAITVGSTTRQATYQSGSGTQNLLFRYTIQSGESDTDGIAVGTLAANGGTLRDGSGNDATLTLNSVGSTSSVLVDAIAPTVTSVSVPSNATYVASQNLDFTVNFNENVTVVTTGGTPQIAITVGSTTRQATYQSGSGTQNLLFRYTIQSGESDTDGIAVGTLAANGGTLRDGSGNDATLTLNSVGSTSSVLVDAVAPTVSSVSVPSNATYVASQNLNFTVNFNENVTVVTTGGTPQIAITIGSTTRQATYQSGSGTQNLLFRYTIQSGESDTDGIAVGTLAANGGTLRDGSGNDATLTLNSVGSTSSVLVDAVAPANPVVTTPSSTISVNSATQTISGTHIENGVTVHAYADVNNDGAADNSTSLANATVSSNTWSLNVNLIADSANNFVVRAVDTAGNVSSDVNIPTITEVNSPVLTATTPADNAVNVTVGGNLTMTFNQNVVKGTGNILIKNVNGNATIESIDVTSAQVSIANNVVTINPSTNLPGETQIYVEVPAGVVQNGTGLGNSAITGNSTWNFTTQDVTGPTVVLSTITSSPTNLPFTTTITLSEAVTNFDLTDITVTNGTASIFNRINPLTYSVLITPLSDGEVTVNIGANRFQDVSSNSNNNTASNTLRLTYDATRPTVMITSNAVNPTNAAFTATFTFSEAMASFAAADVTISNAAISNFTMVSTTVYTATITPTADGNVTLDIAANTLEDNANNGNDAATQFSILYDGTRPTVAITSSATSPTNGAFTATFIFSENVTGFAMSDITVGNGMVSNFNATSGSVYSATITPTADGNITLDVAANVAQDGASNPNTAATQFSILYDATRPTVVISSGVTSPANAAYSVTITFSESVSGFTVSDLNVGNGVASNLSGSGSVYTATITPNSDGGVIVFLPENLTQDAAGNGNTISNEHSTQYDATVPTVTMSTIAMSPINAAFTLDIQFSEAVTGFDISDLSVTNGTASNFVASSTTVYSALITPSASADVTVNIAQGAAQDAATNGNVAAQFMIAYDNMPPDKPLITHISEYTCSGNIQMTGDNTLEITGTAEVGSIVEVFIGGTSIGTTLTTLAGFFTLDHTGITLADGNYSITARATDAAMNTSVLSDAFSIVINTVDTDGDGIADFCDTDVNGNGNTDTNEDCDGDGIIDSQDTDNSSCSTAIGQTRTYGFSPNNDGVNDGWVIENITAFPNSVVSVYNRSGKLVFKQKGYQNDWQAVSNQISNNGSNTRLPVGPYLFLIDLGDGSRPTRGWLYINY